MKFFYVYYTAHTIYHLIALRGLIVGQQRQVTRYAQILLRIVGRIFADDLVPFCIFARFSEQKKKTGLHSSKEQKEDTDSSDAPRKLSVPKILWPHNTAAYAQRKP